MEAPENHGEDKKQKRRRESGGKNRPQLVSLLFPEKKENGMTEATRGEGSEARLAHSWSEPKVSETQEGHVEMKESEHGIRRLTYQKCSLVWNYMSIGHRRIVCLSERATAITRGVEREAVFFRGGRAERHTRNVEIWRMFIAASDRSIC